MGPSTKAPVIRHRIAPAFGRCHFYRGVAFLALGKPPLQKAEEDDGFALLSLGLD
jgi:hypothetical protein